VRMGIGGQVFLQVVTQCVELAPDGTPLVNRGRVKNVPIAETVLATMCTQALDCDTCLSQDNCGWCQGKKCVPGGPSGPDSGSCSSWSFDFCPNQSECPYTTCDACLNDADCGWCSDSKHCFLGNASQPLDGNCPSSSYYYTSCPGTVEQSTEYFITFSSMTSACDVCGTTGAYICYDGTYASISATTFMDPTPSGSTVVQVKLSMTGVYTQDVSFQVDFNVNNSTFVPIAVSIPENSNSFSCDAPCTTYGGQSSEFSSGLPGWNYGGSNFIGWSGYEGYNACYTQLDLTIIYTDDTNKLQQIVVKN